jgi:hypothetical protein
VILLKIREKWKAFVSVVMNTIFAVNCGGGVFLTTSGKLAAQK